MFRCPDCDSPAQYWSECLCFLPAFLHRDNNSYVQFAEASQIGKGKGHTYRFKGQNGRCPILPRASPGSVLMCAPILHGHLQLESQVGMPLLSCGLCQFHLDKKKDSVRHAGIQAGKTQTQIDSAISKVILTKKDMKTVLDDLSTAGEVR